jgi:hypothetical protein
MTLAAQHLREDDGVIADVAEAVDWRRNNRERRGIVA